MGASSHSSAGSDGLLPASEVLAWAAAADGGDDVDAALRLLELVERLPDSGPASVSVSVDRARLLLLSERAADGLAVLRQAGVEQIEREGASKADCVLAACLAATGRQDAFEWLLWAAGQFPATARWWTTYLVGAAADARGERELAGRAWCSLVSDHGIRTAYTVPRAAAALVEGRSRIDVATGVRAVAHAVEVLSSLPTPPAEDPSPALLAVTRLQSCGDDAGARLLLTALVARLGAVPPLVQLLRQATPHHAQRRYVWRTRLAGGAAFVALGLSTVFVGPTPLHVVAIVAVLLGRHRWQQLVGVPGFDKVDSGIWRAFHAVHYDVRTGVATTTRRRRISQLDVAGVFIGLVLAIPVATAATRATREVLGTSTPVRQDWADSIGTAVFLSVLALCMAVSSAWQRSSGVKRREATREARRALSGLSTCRCWGTARLAGEEALLYGRQHLAAAAEPGLLQVVQGLSPSAEILRCQTTGTLWLAAPSALSGHRLLLRGSVGDPPAVEAQVAASTGPGRATGFYL